MYLRRVFGVMTLTLAVPALAAAQAGAGGATTGTTTTTTTTTTGGDQPTATTSQPDLGGTTYGTAQSRWIASGYVGSNFGASAEQAAPDFGGSIGYLWNNWVGGEFLAGFTPNFEAQNLALFADERPQVNSYMANAVAAIPMGPDANWQPFISGGFGAVTLRSSVDTNGTAVGNALNNTFVADDTRAGGNIGAGLMGFVGNWGIRGDVRYFRAFGDNNGSNGATATNTGSFLEGLDFWRANIGVAVRW